MTIKFTCRYCNHSWIDKVYYEPKLAQCKICKDTNIKFVDIKETYVDYYIGCEPFAEDLFKEVDFPANSID